MSALSELYVHFCTATDDSPLWDCSNPSTYDKDTEFTEFISYYRNNLRKRSINFIEDLENLNDGICLDDCICGCDCRNILVLPMDGRKINLSDNPVPKV